MLDEELNKEEKQVSNQEQKIENEKKSIEELGLDPENPNDSGVEEAEEKTEKTHRVDDIDGEINIHNSATDLSYFKPLSYSYDGLSNIDDEVERQRQIAQKKMQKSRILNIVAVCLMIASFVAVLLTIFLCKVSAVVWTVLALAVVVIIGSFILTSALSKKDNKHIQAYLESYEEVVDAYVIYNQDVTEPLLCPDAKVDENLFIQAHCFRTISSIDSRSVLLAKRKGKNLQIAEMAASVPSVSLAKANEQPQDFINLDGTIYINPEFTNTMTGTTELQSQDMTLVDINLSDEANDTKNASKRKRDEERAKKELSQAVNNCALFGRFYSYDMKVESEQSVIIYFMGERKYTMLPDYLTGFKAVKVPGLRSNIVVYAADISKSKIFFDEEGVKLLNAVVPNQIFQSAFISINSYGTKIGMNLSDEIMNIPLKKSQVPNSIEMYKEASDRILNFVDHVDSLR